MKYRTMFYILLIAAGFSFLFTQYNCNKQPEKKEMSKEEMIQRGEYLVRFGGCNDCHTPKIWGPNGPMEDTTRVLSGHPSNQPLPPIPTAFIGPDKWAGVTNGNFTAWAGPWGVSFAKNLTPDEPTGIGNWTEEIFIKAMRTGKDLGFGRNILPPMPWFGLAALNDEDLKSIFAYLKSLKPIHNQVPEPIPPDSLFKMK